MVLKSEEPPRVEGVPQELHWLPPHIPKISEEGLASWGRLGDCVVQAENDIPVSGKIDGSRWISLRLDGTGFSKAVRRLRRSGVLEADGFSADFAAIMQRCCREMMETFSAKVGYTQSDEMTLIIPPASIVRGEQQSHLRSGRVVKLVSVAAGTLTAMFNAKIAQLCVEKGVPLEAEHVLSHFDCRLGHYGSWQEARGLLLWRAYDCSVNGLSDAVHQTKHAGQKEKGLGTLSKLKWLHEHQLLPLPDHQARGSYFVKVRRLLDAVNPKTNENVRVLRGRIEQLDSPVLELARLDQMLPVDDVDDAAMPC